MLQQAPTLQIFDRRINATSQTMASIQLAGVCLRLWSLSPMAFLSETSVGRKKTNYVAGWSNAIRLLPPMERNNRYIFVAFAPVTLKAIILSVDSMASIDVHTQQSYEFGEGLEENAEAEKMTQQ